MARRESFLAIGCRYAPVAYVKWKERNERIQMIGIAWPAIMLSLVALFVASPWIMIRILMA